MVEYVLKIDIDETDLVRKLKSAMKKAGSIGLGQGGILGGGAPKGGLSKAITQATPVPKELVQLAATHKKQLGKLEESLMLRKQYHKETTADDAKAAIEVESFKIEGRKGGRKEEFDYAQQKAATKSANTLEHIKAMQADWKKRMFNAGTIVKLAGLATGVAGLLQFRKIIIDSSPMLQAMLKILNVGIMFILRPIGDMFGFIMRPLMIPFMQFAVQWYTKSLKMIPVWTKIGQSILMVLNQNWDDASNLWKAAFLEWQGIRKVEQQTLDAQEEIALAIAAAQEEESEGGENITDKEQKVINDLKELKQEEIKTTQAEYKLLIGEIMSFVGTGDKWEQKDSTTLKRIQDEQVKTVQVLQEIWKTEHSFEADWNRFWAQFDSDTRGGRDPKYLGEEEPIEITQPWYVQGLMDGWNDFIGWLKKQGILQFSSIALKTEDQIEEDKRKATFIGPPTEEVLSQKVEEDSTSSGIPVGVKWLFDNGILKKPEEATEESTELKLEPLPPWVGSLEYIFGKLNIPQEEQTPYSKYQVGDVLPQFEPTTQAVTAPQWSDEFLADLAKIVDAIIDKPQQTTSIIDRFEEARDNQFVDYVGKMGRLERQEEERQPDKGDPYEIGREGLSILGEANYGKSEEQLTTEEKLIEQEKLAVQKMEDMGYTKPTKVGEITEDDFAKSGGFITKENIEEKRERLAELQVLHEDAENALTEAIKNGENGREQADSLRVIMDEEHRIVDGIHEITGEFADIKNLLHGDLQDVANILRAGFTGQAVCGVVTGGGSGGGRGPYCYGENVYCGPGTGGLGTFCCMGAYSGGTGSRPVAPDLTGNSDDSDDSEDAAYGGVISEEILGTGKITGKKYRFGEKGSEVITPMNEYKSMITKMECVSNKIMPRNLTNTPIKAMAEGGVIEEEIFGIGQETGKRYKFGEKGDEAIIPLDDFNTMISNTKRIGIPDYITSPTQRETNVGIFEGISGGRIAKYTRNLYEAQGTVRGAQEELDEYNINEFEGEKTEEYRKPTSHYYCGLDRIWKAQGGGIGTRNTTEYKEWLAGQSELQTQLSNVQNILDIQEERIEPYADMFSPEHILQALSGGLSKFESSIVCAFKQINNQGDTNNITNEETTSHHNVNEGDTVIHHGSQTTNQGSNTTNLGGITINVNSSAQNSDQLIVELGPKILKYLQDNDSRVGIR